LQTRRVSPRERFTLLSLLMLAKANWKLFSAGPVSIFSPPRYLSAETSQGKDVLPWRNDHLLRTEGKGTHLPGAAGDAKLPVCPIGRVSLPLAAP
jgi:hypothetical protein